MDSGHHFDVNSLTEDELSQRWRQESLRYVSTLNEFVAKGIATGWKNIDESDEPKDTRQPLAALVLDVVRRANASKDFTTLRERFPPAHGPFVGILDENGQSLPMALLLEDGRIIVRISSPYEPGRVAIIEDTEIQYMAEDIITVGRSPSREYFALAHKDAVQVRKGWDGPIESTMKWPTGQEGVPAGFNSAPIQDTPVITQLIPFDSGQQVLLVSPDGVFVLNSEFAVRLLPTEEELKEHFDWLQKEYPADSLSYDLSMEHGAISPDGKFIACGHQSSLHYIFDANTLKIAGTIGNLSEYPHYAVFSKDSSIVALNSCHFYNGITLGVPLKLLPGLKTEPYKADSRLLQLEDGSRVYAAVSRNDEFIIGDASGYLRAFSLEGKPLWQHFIGSSMGSIDVSTDGKQLIATTYAGFLCIIDLDMPEADPFTIGTSSHRESRRWLFWKKESRPLMW